MIKLSAFTLAWLMICLFTTDAYASKIRFPKDYIRIRKTIYTSKQTLRKHYSTYKSLADLYAKKDRRLALSLKVNHTMGKIVFDGKNAQQKRWFQAAGITLSAVGKIFAFVRPYTTGASLLLGPLEKALTKETGWMPKKKARETFDCLERSYSLLLDKLRLAAEKFYEIKMRSAHTALLCMRRKEIPALTTLSSLEKKDLITRSKRVTIGLHYIKISERFMKPKCK